MTTHPSDPPPADLPPADHLPEGFDVDPAYSMVLSSRSIPTDLPRHVRGHRALLVANAADVFGVRSHERASAADAAKLAALGFRVLDLDLRAYHAGRHRDGHSLADLVSQADLVWAGGGSTFWLVHLLHRSGLAALVPDLLRGGLTWGGSSAGAVACAPTLAGVDREDDPSMSPDPSQPGLGLVPFLAWAHWNPRRPGHQTRHAPLEGVTTPMYRIRDGEHLVISNGDVRLVGSSVPVAPAEELALF